jgi:hypothetical protein
MLDKDFLIQRMDTLLVEVSRIEFSCDFSNETVECAAKARKLLETLIENLKYDAQE